MLRLLGPTCARILSRVAVPVLALAAMSLSSCSALYTGMHSMTAHFPVKPQNGEFHSYTKITVGADVSSVGLATLVAVTLRVQDPAGIPDLSFFQSLEGRVTGKSGIPTKVVSLNDFPKGEPVVTLENDYLGDLHPLFQDERMIHIDWSGTMNPAYTNWPANGFVVEGEVTIDIH